MFKILHRDIPVPVSRLKAQQPGEKIRHMKPRADQFPAKPAKDSIVQIPINQEQILHR